ncbi:MAG: hypothetical protein QW390_04835 [Candidatus Bathyarchaeia archaeon]
MPRRGPFPETEKQDLSTLSTIPEDSGIGFNELWRRLKQKGTSLSYTTLAKTLKRLTKADYVQVRVKRGKAKIAQRAYTKTSQGKAYEQHLASKLRASSVPSKSFIKVREGSIKYGQIIFSSFPFTYELELSAPKADEKAEENITRLVGDMGETLIHNVAEILNATYSKFLTDFSTGSLRRAFNGLKEGLNFQLRLTLAFDGRRVKLDKIAERMQENEDELLSALQAIRTPSQTELLGCWIMTLLSPLIPPQDFPYDLSSVDGWAKLIEEYGNRWRRSKGVPPLKRSDIEGYLKELIQRGQLAIRPIRLNSGILEFKEMPEPQPEEFYSFLLSIFSGMKSLLSEQLPNNSNSTVSVSR